jgi:peptidoglycan hydrolase-like protein with peptidoglycan-binding domain
LLSDGARLWVANRGDAMVQFIPPDVGRTSTPTPTPSPFPRNLYLTDPHPQDDDVLLLQQSLVELGYTEVGTLDGNFGAKTNAAVLHFQEVNGLEADGVVGPKTWARLFRANVIGVK